MSFDPDSTIDKSSLQYSVTPEWDSIAHMTLIAALEDEFGITFETEEVIEMGNYQIIEDILTKKLVV